MLDVPSTLFPDGPCPLQLSSPAWHLPSQGSPWGFPTGVGDGHSTTGQGEDRGHPHSSVPTLPRAPGCSGELWEREVKQEPICPLLPVPRTKGPWAVFTGRSTGRWQCLKGHLGTGPQGWARRQRGARSSTSSGYQPVVGSGAQREGGHRQDTAGGSCRKSRELAGLSFGKSPLLPFPIHCQKPKGFGSHCQLPPSTGSALRALWGSGRIVLSLLLR